MELDSKLKNQTNQILINQINQIWKIKSPKRDSLDPTHLFTHFDNGLLNVSPLHGVRFKVEKPNQSNFKNQINKSLDNWLLLSLKDFNIDWFSLRIEKSISIN